MPTEIDARTRTSPYTHLAQICGKVVIHERANAELCVLKAVVMLDGQLNGRSEENENHTRQTTLWVSQRWHYFSHFSLSLTLTLACTYTHTHTFTRKNLSLSLSLTHTHTESHLFPSLYKP